jgi:hypothetical protein
MDPNFELFFRSLIASTFRAAAGWKRELLGSAFRRVPEQSSRPVNPVDELAVRERQENGQNHAQV